MTARTSFVRTVVSRSLWVLLWLAWAGSVAGLLAYAVGRGATDRFHVTQFLFWVPGWMILLGATLLAAPGCVWAWRLWRTPRASGAAATGKMGRRIAWFIAACLALAWLHYGVIELRLWRVVWPAARAAEGKSLRIAHWNAAGAGHWPQGGPLTFPKDMFAAFRDKQGKGPDILLFAAAMSGEAAAGHVRESLGEGYEIGRRGSFFVASRFKVLRSRSFALELARPGSGAGGSVAGPGGLLTGKRSRTFVEWVYGEIGPTLGLPPRNFRNSDPGTLTVFELDTTAVLGRALVVHSIDLPSDPVRSKRDLMEHAAEVIAGLERGEGKEKIPAADVLAGDFNTPRGSDSLGFLSAGMRSAYDQAGWGVSATWPRAWPVMQIDLMYLAPWLRASGYRTVDPGVPDHLGIEVEVGRGNE